LQHNITQVIMASTIAVRGLGDSKAASNQDGGVQSLKTFLLKKASRPIIEYTLRGDTFYMQVKDTDAARFTHLNGFVFAGTTLSVSEVSTQQTNNTNTSNSRSTALGNHQVSDPHRRDPPRGPRGQTPTNGQSRRLSPNNNRELFPHQGSSTRAVSLDRRQPTKPSNLPNISPEIEQIIISVLQKRYIAADKYLNLESLALDPEIQAAGLAQYSAKEFFEILFHTIKTKIFPTEKERREMVTSISLRNISLSSAGDVFGLPKAFPELKNLDLSQNNISETGDLRFWRHQFRNLEHLILSENPIDLKPETMETMIKWYPNLKLYNKVPVKQEQQPPQAAVSAGIVPPQTPSIAAPPVQSTSPSSAEQHLKQQMAIAFATQTRLKPALAEECLAANNWDFQQALANAEQLYVNGGLPADAFVS